jgi:hypothetical protein
MRLWTVKTSADAVRHFVVYSVLVKPDVFETSDVSAVSFFRIFEFNY